LDILKVKLSLIRFSYLLMSSKSSNQPDKKPTVNPNVKSSIVHKPFATGTINIFNPYKSKSKSEVTNPKLFLNAELEPEPESPQPEPRSDLEVAEIVERDRHWFDSLLSPWGISAIAMLFFANLIAAGVIWRNFHLAIKTNEVKSLSATVGNANLANQEFMPLNLSTLSMIKTVKETTEQESKPKLVPISPALAPLNDLTALSTVDPQYYYVLTEYTGEQSLSLAQQKVKQISLVNFPQGVFIYLGAFTKQQQAEEFVLQLKQENFPAHIYPFD
ncbi:MAG: SPOR domain-containing protein, partial [Waterburya sp.]